MQNKGIKMARGRKPMDDETININVTIRFNKKELEEIEKIAKSIDIPKTRLIRNMALAGLEDAKILHKIGALKGAKKLKDFMERLKNPEKYENLQIA